MGTAAGGGRVVAYLVIDYEVADAEGFGAYEQVARPLIAQYGGVYLAAARGPEVLEGDPHPKGVALIEFPSLERLRAFWASPEYAAVKPLRAGKATFAVRAVDGR
jgi:uncharacterized protein (DUF1330 family)